MNIKTTFLITAIFFGLLGRANAGFVLSINYTGPGQYAPAFNSAKGTLENLLVDYQNGLVVSRSSGSSYTVGQQVSQVFINATVTAIDGVGGILGQAGPTETVTDVLSFTLATDGIMRFDSADVEGLFSSGRLEPVILHEMAHVLGFGTLWTANGVYINGTGEFTGVRATAAWMSEFGQVGTPDVELGGGAGTANGHWNEVDGGGGLTGIRDTAGRDMRDELMTGWLNPNPFISNMTVQSFVDIGFTGVTAVPEPGSLALLFLGIGAVGGVRLRSRMRGSKVNCSS